MRKLLLPTTLLFLALATACGGDDDDGAGTSSATPDAPATATTRPVDCTANEAVASDEIITWEQIAPDPILAPSSYEITDAEGDAPFLSVSRNGAPVGNLELLQFDLPNNLDPALGINGLEAWAADFYQGVGVERGAGFESHPPAPAQWGAYCAMAFGYTVTDDAGEVIENYAAVATYDPQKLYLVVALYDEATPETSWSTAEDLAGYKPALTSLTASLNFPPD